MNTKFAAAGLALGLAATGPQASAHHSPKLAARKGRKNSTLKPGSVIDVTLPGGEVLWNADSVSQP